MADKKELKNIRALSEFRLKGKVVAKDEVIAKADFAKNSDWRNLVHMNPKARAEETDDAVGKAKGDKGDGGGLPGAKK